MSYLLDADWIISFLNGQRRANELINQLAQAGLFVSVVAYGEVYEGLLARPEFDKHFEALSQFVAMVDLLTLDVRTAQTYGTLRAFLRAQGLLIPDNDLWIAATALTHELTVVSRDQHFSRIPDLKTYPLA